MTTIRQKLRYDQRRNSDRFGGDASLAKGNDGNYLQHCIEVEAVAHLVRACPDGRLHVALTHGMAPFEKFKKSGAQKDLLCGALREAAGEPKCCERVIVKAYRNSRASQKRYPNSAELLRTVIGTNQLCGGITEVCQTKHGELKKAWCGSGIVVAQSSWRKQLKPNEALACPDHLNAPWLFSMDPMTYIENSHNDDANLHHSDLDLLAPALKRYVDSGQPGIASLFVYSVGSQGENRQHQFWTFMDALAGRLSLQTFSYWVSHQGGNLNLAGLLFSGIELSDDFVPPRINTGRGN